MMKKWFRLVPLALTTVCLFTGCHGKKSIDAFEIPEFFDETKEYEISFWAKNDSNKNQVAVYNQAIADFEKIYPNIHVNVKLYSNYQNIFNDVITNISTNTTPNVCITYPDHIATYMAGKNVVVPLDELIQHEQYGLGGSAIKYDSVSVDQVVNQFMEEVLIDGKTYALPYMRSTEACYINKDYVEKLGYEVPEVLTWDYIFEVSEAAMEMDANGNYKVNDQNVLIPFIYKSTDNMLIQMLRQRGADYSDDDGNILIFNDDTRDILEMVAEHGRTKAFSTFKISSYPANFLNAGQCIFAVDSTAGSTWMGTDAPLSDISADKLKHFTTEVRLIPQFDPDNPQIISQGPSICLFNKADSGEVMASWLFMQFLLTNDVQIAYSQTEGYIPVTYKAIASPEYQNYLNSDVNDALHYDVKLKATKLLIDNIDSTFVTPVFNGSASLREAAGQLIENVVKSVRRKEAIDDKYMDKMFDEVEALYRLDSISQVSSEKSELGPLPREAVTLIVVLAVIWALIIAYNIRERIKKRS